MAGKNIHVVRNGDQWKVKQENAQRSSGNFRTQQEAFERAREIAIKNGQEVAIHGLDGRIRESIATAMTHIHQRVKSLVKS